MQPLGHAAPLMQPHGGVPATDCGRRSAGPHHDRGGVRNQQEGRTAKAASGPAPAAGSGGVAVGPGEAVWQHEGPIYGAAATTRLTSDFPAGSTVPSRCGSATPPRLRLVQRHLDDSDVEVLWKNERLAAG